ncbi:hypothetical protein ACM0CO_19595 [Mycobacteroides abscessus subsp. abscessus]|uniref:hypothetical protein n=1 Tax=Mycobacteroides abscessus TaxID=36809 RepID=UPI0039EFF58B
MTIRVGVSDRDVLKRDLEGVFPWAPDEALDEATELVAAQLDKYETATTYTMERFESARAAADELAELVGQVPAIAARRVGRTAGLLGNILGPYSVRNRLSDDIRRVFGPPSSGRS